MKQIEQFYTRDNANKGIEIKLHMPNGELSEHSLTIKGTDSDAFKLAEHTVRNEMIGFMEIEDRDVVYQKSRALDMKLLASLISGWSFTNEDGSPYPCTVDNVVTFLTEAPQIAEKINSLAAQRSLFTKGESNNSAKQPKEDLPSTNKSKDQNKTNVKSSTKSGKRQVESQKS